MAYDPWKCRVCDGSFGTRTRFRQHVQHKHFDVPLAKVRRRDGDDDCTYYGCPECGRRARVGWTSSAEPVTGLWCDDGHERTVMERFDY